MTTDNQIEQEIQAKGLTAPRVTPADIEENIQSIVYFTAFDGLLGEACSAIVDQNTKVKDIIFTDGCKSDLALALMTFCVIVLKNGYTVTGESACASPENFNAEIGRKIARQNAVQKIWPLMGYALKEQLSKI